MTLRGIVDFVTVGVWRVAVEELSPMRRLAYNALKQVYLAVSIFVNKGVMNAASALTYSTLLAVVPMLAVLFGIARGFGLSRHVEAWLKSALEGQPEVAAAMAGFANSYIEHTHSGTIIGIGLVLMLFTVIMLIRNIERVFNQIWLVKEERTLMRTVTDYTAILLLLPLVIILTSGVSIFMAAFAEQFRQSTVLGPISSTAINLLPYVVMSAVFIAAYVFMPNTKVRVRSAIVPGILAGVAMQVLQFVYIHSQMFLSSYNAIYGSFAALPLFMLWLQVSWTICLFGAELTYANQRLEYYAFLSHTDDLSHRYRLLLSVSLMSLICKRFDQGKKPYTAAGLKAETGIPIRITTDLLYDMVRVRLLSTVSSGIDGETYYQPAEALGNLTVGTLVDRLEALGNWHLNISLHKLAASGELQQLIGLRKEYLGKLRGIRLADLQV